MAFFYRSASQAIRLQAPGRLCFSSRLSPPCQNRRSATSIFSAHTSSFSTIAQESESEFEYDGLCDEAKTHEKDNALREAISHLAGDFGKESMLSLCRFFCSRREPVISTGSLKLDLALGIGGLPKGRIVEIYGQEASGKTTLALHIIKEAQKLGGRCAYFDVENAMDASLADSMGVDTENLIFFRQNSAENLLSAIDTLTKSGSIDVIVVDSVAALVPQQEIDDPVGSSDKDTQSRIMTQSLRRIHHSLSHSKTLLVFVNQVRFNPKTGKTSGHFEETTCGGNALRFYAAVRLRLARRELLKTNDKAVGLSISVQVVKNKLSPITKKADLGIRFGLGFDTPSEIFELACEHGVILKEGSVYNIEGKVFCDKYEAQRHLSENEIVLDKITKYLRDGLFES